MAQDTQLTTQTETKAPARAQREYAQVQSSNIIMDSAFFDHIYRVANLMALSGMMPDSLAKFKGKDESGRDATLDLPSNMVLARAFMVAEMAARLNESPFVMMQHVSYVHGKLMFEGKLIHAILEKNFGIKLAYKYGKWDARRERTDLSAEGEGDMLAVTVVGAIDGADREVHGSVGMWKTTGNGSPWKPGAMRRQLAYRGAREFMRLYAPAALLGVITDDEELPQAVIEAPRRKASEKLAGRRGEEGFSIEHVHNETGASGGDHGSAALANAVAESAAQNETRNDKIEQARADLAEDSIPGETDGGGDAAAEATNDGAAEETEEKPDTSGPSDFIMGKGDGEPHSDEAKPESEPTDDASEAGRDAPSGAFDTFNALVDKAINWLEIDTAFNTLAQSTEWEEAAEWEKRATRVTAWERVEALRAESKQIVIDPRENNKAFLCWLETAQDAKAIGGMYSKLKASPVYKKLAEAQQQYMDKIVEAALERVKAAS